MTFCNIFKVKVTTTTCYKPPDWLPQYAILFGLLICGSWYEILFPFYKSLPNYIFIEM